ncbi:MAG: minor capsid protein [Schwartzia sp.]|nr:minor capsid protein [Schwartzia sp. (in: firmicutes)]
MKSSEYWQRRFDELEAALLRKGERYNASEVERQFKMAMTAIEKEISYWYQRLGSNNGVSAAEARRLLSADELREFHWTVEEYIKYGRTAGFTNKWMKQLENASAKAHISRLDAIKLQIQQQIEVLYGNQVDGLDRLMRDIYTEGYNRSAYTIDKGMGVHYNLASTDSGRIDTIINQPWAGDGKIFSDRLWRDKDKLVNTLQQEMTQAVTRGDKLGDAVKKIASRMNVAKSSAARLVMTESAFISGRSQRDCFKGLGVNKYEYVATLDRKTSEICQEMDGKVFDIDDYKPGTNAPPMHCWCRSCIAPYFDDEEISERAARDPKTGKTVRVPESMTYREWEKKYEAPIPKQVVNKDSTELTSSANSVIGKLNENTSEQRFVRSDYDAAQKLHIERLAEYEKLEKQAGDLDLDFVMNPTESTQKAAIEAAEKRNAALKAMQETETAIKAARSVYQAKIEYKILNEGLASGIKLSADMDVDAMDTIYNVAKKLVSEYKLPKLPNVEYQPAFFKMLGIQAHATYDWNKKRILLNDSFSNAEEYKQHRKHVEQQYKDRKASLREVYENQLKTSEASYKAADDKGHKAMAQSSINYAKAELMQNRYAVAETIDDTLIHEYGHYLHDTLSYWEKGFHLFGSKIMKSVKINNEYFWNNSLTGKVEAAKVSGYATENPRECFAESFNAFMKGKKLPDSLDKMMREAFEKTGAKAPIKVKSFEDVTKLYQANAKPRTGEISREEGYRSSRHRDEEQMASWLHETFGGDIQLINEKTKFIGKSPDYIWDGKAWDLKSVSTINAADNAVRSGVKQIQQNTGGLILKFNLKEFNLEKILAIVKRRMERSMDKVMDIMILDNGKLVGVFRYTPLK